MTWRLAVRALAAAMALALMLAAHAQADIYWANQGGTTIGRSDNAGKVVDPSFIPNQSAPSGVAVDGGHVYWAHGNGIGRANLDGSHPAPFFVKTAGTPRGVALDSAFVYWTNMVAGNGRVGRATLRGAAPTSSLIATGPAPCGVAADGDKEFWANGGSPGSIGRAHGIFDPEQDFVTATSGPCGVAEAGGYLYWANRTGGTIGRADLEGTNPKPSFIPTGNSSDPCGVAVDGAHVYWTSVGGDSIGRADLNGSNPDPHFITTGAQDPCGIAVSPTAHVTPAAHAFSATEVGGHSDSASLFLVNTSSSMLAARTLSFAGANAADFQLTADGCTISATPPGQGCVVNVRFAPRRTGARRGTLRIATNGSDSPTTVPLTGSGIAPGSGDHRPASDTIPPRLFRFGANPRVFRHPQATLFHYVLSEDAEVRFTLKRELPGAWIDGKCVRATGRKRAKRRHCHRLQAVGGFVQQGFAGSNTRRFLGRVRHHRLGAGRYRARLVATDFAGNRSKPVRTAFTIAARRKRGGT